MTTGTLLHVCFAEVKTVLKFSSKSQIELLALHKLPASIDGVFLRLMTSLVLQSCHQELPPV